MIRTFPFALILLFSVSGLAFGESISITIKPAVGLSGTKSFNIHSGGEFTVLNYQSRTEIREEQLSVKPEILSKIKNLSFVILEETMATQDYSGWPEGKETFSVAITKEKVTKSISTRRFSKNISTLKTLLESL